MSAQHTPGPWTTNCSHIYAPDGAIIAVVHNPGRVESDYPLVANRDLMAAAPELLEALYQYRSDLRHPPASDSVERRLAMIEKLITKATGAA